MNVKQRYAHAAHGAEKKGRAAISTAVAAALIASAACDRAPGTGGGPADGASRPATTDARIDELEARFRPGLHSLMVNLQFRHANLWFAGEAGNWALADYHMHEVEELVENVTSLHPTYDDVPVGELMTSLLEPAVQELAAAVDDGDAAAFAIAFDRMTAQCNACHQTSGRAMIVVQRPRTPPFDNVRYAPGPDGR